MQEQCESNGYSPFENAIQKAIAHLVPLGTAQPISTLIATLHREEMIKQRPRSVRGTHTVALMELSESAVSEITHKLLDAGYDHAVIAEKDGIMLDMTGIGIVKAKP